MKRHPLTVAALLFLGCESQLPGPAPEPDHLVADIAKLNADLLACEQRENDRLRAERDALDGKIATAKQEALDLLISTQRRQQKRQP